MSCSKGGRKRLKRRHTKRTQKKRLIAYGKIYAIWCGHCKSMITDWEKVEVSMKPLKATNIESENKDELVDTFNRKYKTNLDKNVGFPTIFRLFNKGEKIEIYESGDRSYAAMMKWFKSPPKKVEEDKPKPNTIFNFF